MSLQIDAINNALVLDVLREIGNIGAGNAATSLAKMIDKKIDMKVPIVKVLEFNEVPELLGGPENVVCGIFFRIEGDITGSIMYIMDQTSAFNLVDLMIPRDHPEFDEFTISALKEIGNILSGAYVSSLSGLTNLKITISIPAISIDMAGAILSVPAIHFSQMSDNVLIIQNEFIETNDSKKVDGYFFLIPDLDSYEVLLGSLGVSI